MPRRVLTLAAAALVLSAWCAFASGFPRGTAGAWAIWATSAAAVVTSNVLFGRARRGQRPRWHLAAADHQATPPAPDRRLLSVLWPWLVVAGVITVWEVLGIATGRHQPHLTLSAITSAFRSIDAATLWFWIAVGVGYGAARSRRPSDTVASAGPPHAGLVAAGAFGGHRWTAVFSGLLLPDSQAAGVAFWLAVLAAMVGIECWARHSAGRVATAEQLVWRIGGWRLGHAVAFAVWLYAGWHLFAH